MDAGEHVAYLGAFLTGGLLWRGDLFRSGGKYFAEQVMTSPDGSWVSARHLVVAQDQDEAVDRALAAAVCYVGQQGHDLAQVQVIHQQPARSDMAISEHVTSYLQSLMKR